LDSQLTSAPALLDPSIQTHLLYVNMARTGCQTCKIRRIKVSAVFLFPVSTADEALKCDGNEPICQRCAKSRRSCSRDCQIKPVRLSFHLENDYASGITKRPRGPRPSASPSLLRPSLDIPSLAVTYFLYHYLDHFGIVSTFSACMSECVTEWKAVNRISRMVDLAISAVALGVFSHTQQQASAAREAVRSYRCLLGVVRERITQAAVVRCDEGSFDEFLITIVLMAWYETVMYQCVNVKNRDPMRSMHSWSHQDGALAILKVWSEQRRECSPSSIVKQTRRGLIRSAIARNYFLPDWVQDGSLFGENGLDLEFDAILVQVANLKSTLKALGPDESADPSLIEKLRHQARELDNQCSRWAEVLPNQWSYESYRLPSSRTNSEFGTVFAHVCSRHTYAAVWVQLFAVRLLLNNVCLYLLKRTCTPLDSRNAECHRCREKCQIQLQTLTHDLMCIVPSSLGRVKKMSIKAIDEITLVSGDIPPSLALPVVWPLSIVSRLNGIESGQQVWLRALLANLGRVLGDGALECAGSDLWTHS
jgi:hypothetical protein